MVDPYTSPNGTLRNRLGIEDPKALEAAEADITGFAETYADINALHPFREGNGRTRRAFLQQLARDAGHPLSWATLDAAENERAGIAGFSGGLGPLTSLLDKLVDRHH